MFVDSRTWDPLLPMLKQDRRYVLVDGPGLGRSDALTRESNIAEAADAAQDMLASLQITEPVDWIGNAFGGHVGFKLGARPGVLRSLVVVSAPAEPVPVDLRRQIALLGPLLRILGPVGPVRSAILSAMLADASAADPAIRQAVLASLALPTRRSMSMALRSFIVNRDDVTDELATIGVPSLYVASDDRGDWSPEDAAAAAALTPHARTVTISGARTLVPLEQPERLATELQRFWASLE